MKEDGILFIMRFLNIPREQNFYTKDNRKLQGG